MSKTLRLLVLVALAGWTSSCTNVGSGGGGGTVQVNFEGTENFTDMGRNYTSLRGADQGYVDELRRHIERTGAARLPAGYTLTLTIRDVDMAGQFEPERGPQFIDVRMVRTIYPPRIHLTYRLADSTGAVVSEGERRLTNRSFDWTVSPITYDDPLHYEQALMDDFLSDMSRQARAASPAS